MISVIIPAKDAAGTIEDCLKGVLSQRSLKMRYEVILVDDGSTDHTAEIARGFDVKVIRQEKTGRVSARNAGALAAHRGRVTTPTVSLTDVEC